MLDHDFEEIPEHLEEAVKCLEAAEGTDDLIQRKSHLIKAAIAMLNGTDGIISVYYQDLFGLITGQGGDKPSADLAIRDLKNTADYGPYPPGIQKSLRRLANAFFNLI